MKNLVIEDVILGRITYRFPDRHCVFCKNCTDYFYDYTYGPYMFLCKKGLNTVDCENCKSFEEG